MGAGYSVMGHPRPSPADIVEFEIDSACHMEKMTSYIQNNSQCPGSLPPRSNPAKRRLKKNIPPRPPKMTLMYRTLDDWANDMREQAERKANGGSRILDVPGPWSPVTSFKRFLRIPRCFVVCTPGDILYVTVAGFCCPKQKRRIMRRTRPIQWGPCPCCEAMINCGEDRTYICILCKQRLTELFEPCRGDDPSLSSDSD